MGAYKLSSDFKRYRGRMFDAGGSFDQSNDNVSNAMGIASTASGVIDGVFGQDSMGRQPMGAAIGSDALKGATMGAVLGPVGAGVGAVAGAAYGFFSNRAQKHRNDAILARQKMMMDSMQRQQGAAAVSANPAIVHGNQFGSFYAMGGPMETSNGTVVRPEDKVQMRAKGSRYRPLAENYLSRMTKAEGGSLTPMSTDSVAINGPTHEQGGVDLPDQQAEVEGGESMKNDFVFSDRLGFADEHKRLERATDRVQSKGVMSPERVNAVRRMQDRVAKLALSQELLKHMLSGGRTPDPTQQPAP